ncbi:MAG TPA: hypothetical protein VFO34_06760 [Candidatus Acidoferrales bacterium]|nr:hypothetical protein [Candidatus Acidoferrales bacterium]
MARKNRNRNARSKNSAPKNPSVTLPGTVEKLIPSADSEIPDKAQIVVHDAEPLYQELRVENVLTSETGAKVGLKEGAEVEVTIEAEPEATTEKKRAKSSG